MSANKINHSKTIWNYNPWGKVVGISLLSVLLVLVAWFYYSLAREVTLVLGLIAIANLISLTKYCRVKIEIEGSNLLYSYKSMFKKDKRLILPDKVKAIQPKEVTTWNQQRMKKLFLVLENEMLVLTPFYTGDDDDVTNLKSKLALISARKEKATNKVAQKSKKKRKERESKNKNIWAMIEMSVVCPRCDSPVLVKGPFTEFTCNGCGEQIDLTPEIWADLLEDTRKELTRMAYGEGSNTTIWGTFNVAITYGHLNPYCKECKRDYNVSIDYKEEMNEIICPDCKSVRPAQKPPEWFNKVIENTKLIIGAAPELKDQQSSERKLFMTCPGCGASIQVSGNTRNEKCSHCDSKVLLPDEVWQHLNPAPTKARWFIEFLT